MSIEALVLIDLQNDFMPTGSLPVNEGDAVVPVANLLMDRFKLVVATQDWHPPRHGSFASNYEGRESGDVVQLGGVEQVLWPDHCVQGSFGASFHSELELTRVDEVVRKGTDPAIDSYSAFFDNAHMRDTGLADLLRSRGVDAVTMLGLATDYCVLFSALDAVEQGFATTVVADGCRAVNLSAQDGAAAFEQMLAAGCDVTDSRTLLER